MDKFTPTSYTSRTQTARDMRLYTGIGAAHLGAGSVRGAGKKGQKAIYIMKSVAQSMSNFRGEATERNYSLSKFRQWPSGKDPHAGNCCFLRGNQNLMSSPTPITLLVRE